MTSQNSDRFPSFFESKWVPERGMDPILSGFRLITDELSGWMSSQSIPVRASLHVVGLAGKWNEARARDAEMMNGFLESAPESYEIVSYEVTAPEGYPAKVLVKDLSGFDEVDLYVRLNEAQLEGELLSELAATEKVGVVLPLTAEAIAEAFALEIPFKLECPAENALLCVAVCLLAYQEDLNVGQIQSLLRQENPLAIKFSTQGFEWESVAFKWSEAKEMEDLLTGIIVDDVSVVRQQLDRL